MKSHMSVVIPILLWVLHAADGFVRLDLTSPYAATWSWTLQKMSNGQFIYVDPTNSDGWLVLKVDVDPGDYYTIVLETVPDYLGFKNVSTDKEPLVLPQSTLAIWAANPGPLTYTTKYQPRLLKLQVRPGVGIILPVVTPVLTILQQSSISLTVDRSLGVYLAMGYWGFLFLARMVLYLVSSASKQQGTEKQERWRM